MDDWLSFWRLVTLPRVPDVSRLFYPNKGVKLLLFEQSLNLISIHLLMVALHLEDTGSTTGFQLGWSGGRVLFVIFSLAPSRRQLSGSLRFHFIPHFLESLILRLPLFVLRNDKHIYRLR